MFFKYKASIMLSDNLFYPFTTVKVFQLFLIKEYLIQDLLE